MLQHRISEKCASVFALQMRRTAYLALFLLIPAAGRAQTVLCFPLVPDASPVGIAIVNPGADAAQVSFAAYGRNGQPIAEDAPTIPAGAQIAKLGSELFSSGRPVPYLAGPFRRELRHQLCMR